MKRKLQHKAPRSLLDTTPPGLWKTLDAAIAGASYELEAPAANVAINLRHRWHRFRQELIRQRYPNAQLLLNVMCSIRAAEGKHTLIFTWLGGDFQHAVIEELTGLDALMSQLPLEQQAEVLGIRLPEQKFGEDEHDKKLRELFGLPKHKPQQDYKPKQEAPCNHEWDITDSFCLHCRQPKESA